MSEISTCDRCGLTSAHTLGCLMEQLAIERNTVAEQQDEIDRLLDRDRRFVGIMAHFGLEFQEDTIGDLMKLVEAADAEGGG